MNLSQANDSLRAGLERLSSGKRINSSRDDAGGMAVGYKLNSRTIRTRATVQNAQNGLSYLQVQDGALETVAKVATRMSELRVLADDITKNSSDVENYSKEFIELQFELQQIKEQKYNGISLFAQTGHTLNGSGTKGIGLYTPADSNPILYEVFQHTLLTHPDGDESAGSVSLKCCKSRISSFDWQSARTLELDLMLIWEGWVIRLVLAVFNLPQPVL